MAKKKKPAANPARGFATTSVASKPKANKDVDIASASSTSMVEPAGGAEVISVPPKDLQITELRLDEPSAKTHELSPEDLEEQLERNELQLMIEKHGPKVVKESSRQISKVQTDRRVLRGQAQDLHTREWLPEELMLQILDLTKDDVSRGNYSREQNGKSKSISEEDSVVKFWALYRTLSEFGVSPEHIQKVIRQLVVNPPSNDSSGQLWGFSEALDLIALECEEHELPSFNRRLQSTAERSAASSTPGTPVDTPASSTINTPERSRTPVNEGTSLASNLNSTALAVPNVDDIEVSDLDSDMEPEELLSKYLSIKVTLYELNPEVFTTSSSKSRAAWKKDNIKPSAAGTRSPGVLKLQKRLQQIESDVLFDKREADAQWTWKRNQLAEEAAVRKKFQLRQPDVGSKGQKEPNGDLNGVTATDEVMKEAANTADLTMHEDGDSDSDSLLGGMFNSMPDELDNSQTAARANPGATIRIAIRDFGKSTGISPRRALEETCRARDSSVKCFYKLVSPTTYASRHSLTLVWSKNQDDLVYSSLPTINYERRPLSATFTMASIATPDTQQSEAYVSTAALFMMFSASLKEEKVHMRLPPAWRDLWAEFVDIKKEQSDTTDRTLLARLRSMVQEQTVRETEEGVVLTKGFQNRSRGLDSSLDANVPRPHENTAKSMSDSLLDLWKQKSSTPAYQRMLPSRANLPIWGFRESILSEIEKHRVVILQGATGCGKSTQLPAFILENELSKGRECKIYCTEPRRISAISLAQRVNEELGEYKNSLGTPKSLVGYEIRLESKTSAHTRLVYATVGIVLRKLESSHALDDITHLVLDEVHERSIDTDFLLIVLQSLMVRRPELKVVLMSATVDAERFSRYLDGAPVLTVPGRTFPVEARFLEDAIELTHHTGSSRDGKYEDEDADGDTAEDCKPESMKQLQSYSPATRNTMMNYDEYRIDFELIKLLIENIAYEPSFIEYSKAILVFMPGLAEIRQLNDILVGHPSFSQGWRIYPLHSTIASDEQQQAFLVPPRGIRKIVIATNIAETGITIPDITAVIDTGKHKEMRFDERRQLSRLIQSFISKANANQRRGRAGRVQKGLCFHLFTKHRYDHMMAEQQTPEMLRLSLQDLVMRVKTCKLGDIEQTLCQALDPPAVKNIRRAIDALIEVDALTPAEELTSLGRQLSRLPLDAHLGKLCLLTCIFGCVDVGITVAAILSSKTPFITPFGARQRADAAHFAFKKGDSDLLTAYNAYAAWRRVCQTRGESEYQFCQKNFLSAQNLSGIEDLKSQLLATLVDMGFVILDHEQKTALSRYRYSSRQRSFVPVPLTQDANIDNDLLVNSVIAWAFYPKLLVRDGKGWRNVANNQSVSLHPTSVNKGNTAAKYLSYYHIMQSSSKFYNAHSTSLAYDLPLLLLSGEADFRMHAGVVIIDGNRLRLAVNEWKTVIALKTLRRRVKDIVDATFKYPDGPLSERQKRWMDAFAKVFERVDGRPGAARAVHRV